MQIIVLGMHRSGTSLVTRIINMMGAYFGPEGISLGFHRDNPKGFWERKDVLYINEQLLKHFDATWHKVSNWDNGRLADTPRALTRSIRRTILDMDAHRPWVMKDPRLCITLPCWLPWLEVPVAVITSRDPLAVAHSLGLRNRIPAEYAMAMWEYYAVHTLNNAAPLAKLFTSYEDMLRTPVETTRTLYESLLKQGVQGLRMPSEREILAFVEPRLQRATGEPVPYEMSSHQKHLASMLRGEMPFEPGVGVSAQARRIMESMMVKVTVPSDQ